VTTVKVVDCALSDVLLGSFTNSAMNVSLNAESVLSLDDLDFRPQVYNSSGLNSIDAAAFRELLNRGAVNSKFGYAREGEISSVRHFGGFLSGIQPGSHPHLLFEWTVVTKNLDEIPGNGIEESKGTAFGIVAF
jgi:hypothetical protein